ncbi:MAG: hypothetical protein ACPGJS_02730 [Flammeovirgaceae bacterium]
MDILSEKEILENIYGDFSHLEKLVMTVSTVRSASTAILRLFAESEFKCYSQPIKSIFRQLQLHKEGVGESTSWFISNNIQSLFIKETLGPFNIYEATLNPINIIQSIIRRTESVRVKPAIVFLFRSPIAGLYSCLNTYDKFMKVTDPSRYWYHKISQEEVVMNYIYAYRHTYFLYNKYLYSDIYDVSKVILTDSESTKEAIQTVFEDLNLKPGFDNWSDESILDFGEERQIVISKDHITQKKAGILDAVNSSNSFLYPNRDLPPLESKYIMKLESYGINSIYDVLIQGD